MKKVFALVSILLFTCVSNAQKITSQDSLQISSIVEDWNNAWETEDYVLATRGYSNDAQFTNAFGDKRNGQKEIELLLKEVFALPFVMAGKSEMTRNEYQVLDENHVIVHSVVIRKGQQMPDGSVLEDRQTTHLRVFQKEGKEWKVKAHLISDARDKQSSKH